MVVVGGGGGGGGSVDVVGGGGGGSVDVVGGGGGVVAAGIVVVPPPGVVGLTLPPVDSSRPGGIEKGSLDPANDTGGSVSRGVGDGVTLGDSAGTPVLPGIPGGPLRSATSSPPFARSTKKYTSSSRGKAIPVTCKILLSRGVICMATLPFRWSRSGPESNRARRSRRSC